MSDTARDEQTGISIRFIKSFDEATIKPGSLTDRALLLAGNDDRDISTMDKIADALTFLTREIH